MKESHPCFIKEGQHLVLVVGKRPLKKGWTEKAATEREVDEHLEAGGGLGIIPFSIDHAVLDLDTPADENLLLGRFPALLQNATAITNSKSVVNGWQRKHVWVRVSEPVRDKQLPTKGHIRCSTGQIVLWPGVIEVLKEVINKPVDRSIIEKNDELIRRFIEANGGTTSNYEEGSRNNSLFYDACRILEKDISKEEKKERLEELAKKAEKSGLDPKDIKATILSAIRRINRDRKNKKEKMDENREEEKPKRKGKTLSIKIANWLNAYYPGIEFIRVSGMDSTANGLQPIIWDKIGKAEKYKWRKPDTNEIAELINLEFPTAGSNAIKEALFYLSIMSKKTTNIKDWDQSRDFLGLSDGMAYNFNTNKVVSQRKKMKILATTPTTIKKKVNMEDSFWFKCLKQWMRSPRYTISRRDEKIKILQMIMGYSLQYGNPLNYIVFHEGKGANGKSAFFKWD